MRRGGLEAASWGRRSRASAWGLIGLGHIGREIARRGALGFGMRVGYCTRRPRPESGYAHYADVRALARDSDFLVV
ncbi:NAD(P)-dependent oxidoreductase, partial [Achromobacter sp. DMS1]|uniref:NAD(P)-dependent oxidoreductase n=1 Tax=Achromobacter sp. DMS1 TaxID=1688405 RepID=UPI00350F29A0